MKRLLHIEWLKLKSYKPFWVLMGMYTLLVLLFTFGGQLILTWLKNQGAEMYGFDPTMLPLYDFPDLWQNLTYLMSYVKIFLAFIVIMSVNNELNHRIIRQNIIDGMDKKEWLKAKFILFVSLAAFSTLLVFVFGLLAGLIYGHPGSFPYIFYNLHFLAAYFFQIFVFLCLALMWVLLLKKGILVMIALLMYCIAFEPLAYVIISYMPNFPDQWRWVADFLPVNALTSLIPQPFYKMAFQETSDVIALKNVIIAVGWLLFYMTGSYWILKKKDL